MKFWTAIVMGVFVVLNSGLSVFNPFSSNSYLFISSRLYRDSIFTSLRAHPDFIWSYPAVHLQYIFSSSTAKKDLIFSTTSKRCHLSWTFSQTWPPKFVPNGIFYKVLIAFLGNKNANCFFCLSNIIKFTLQFRQQK